MADDEQEQTFEEAFEAAQAAELDEHMAEYPGDRLRPSDEDLRAVAEGREPRPFLGTFKHPVHGELVFQMALPRAAALAEQSIATDNLLSGLSGAARGATMVLVTSIAGIQTLMKLPIIDERTVESDESDAEARLERIYYDPSRDISETFVATVWRHGSAWRNAFLRPEALAAVGKSSGATPGSASSTPSDAPGASPSTTRA